MKLDSLSRRTRAWVLALSGLLAGGCASVQGPFSGHLASPALQIRECAEWFSALDAAIDAAGVRDAAHPRVAGFPYLRTDRFHAALAGDAARNPQAVEALADRLWQLDFDARRHEIANLPDAARAELGRRTGEPEITRIAGRTRECGRLLREIDMAKPAQRAALLERLSVPDDYVTGYRIAGLYALTQVPFSAGVRRFQEETRAAFARDPDAPAKGNRLRYSPPERPRLSAERIAAMLRPSPADPLALPQPSDNELDLLFAHFAPDFEIDTLGDDDRPGTLRWRRGDQVEVDGAEVSVYRQAAYTRYRGRNLLQLVYTLWFPERIKGAEKPAGERGGFDLLAGRLDGIVIRVTLGPEGRPLVVDSIHPCGCYHLFFPTPAARPTPAPDGQLEWAFVPQTLPALGLEDRLVVRVAASTHYVERILVDRNQSTVRYAWREYGELRSLQRFGPGFRSVFGPDGFIAGTDRPEAWLFWPMGIERAGTMRQWGRHATAFVGRRHFDDADLFEKRFDIDLK